jgi:hypothetical protein
VLVDFLVRHAQARWIGGDAVDLAQGLAGNISLGLGYAKIQFPFARARAKLANPADMLWMSRVTLLEGPPPRGLAGTVDEAHAGWSRLLPDAAAAVLEDWRELGAEEAARQLATLIDAHPDSALLIRLALPVVGQLPGLDACEVLSRRLLDAWPHVEARYLLADVLACMDVPRHEEAERLFRDVLADQPMMTRARLKLAVMLVNDGRRDAGVSELREVAGAWGEDAEEARRYLEQLGVSTAAASSVEATVADLVGAPRTGLTHELEG